jgi:hypothetical protein
MLDNEFKAFLVYTSYTCLFLLRIARSTFLKEERTCVSQIVNTRIFGFPKRSSNLSGSTNFWSEPQAPAKGLRIFEGLGVTQLS